MWEAGGGSPTYFIVWQNWAMSPLCVPNSPLDPPMERTLILCVKMLSSNRGMTAVKDLMTVRLRVQLTDNITDLPSVDAV